MVAWLADRLRIWMLGVLVVVVATLAVTTGLPGWWALIAYGCAFAFFAAVVISVVDREGAVGGERGGDRGRRPRPQTTTRRSPRPRAGLVRRRPQDGTRSA